jgi:hypothetical protein
MLQILKRSLRIKRLKREEKKNLLYKNKHKRWQEKLRGKSK